MLGWYQGLMKRLFAVAALGLCASCGGPPLAKTALHGDLATLKREIAAAETSELRHPRVLALARAVASREVRSATGVIAVRRLEQMRPCARRLTRVLHDRARRRDDAGATAAMLLLELDERRAPRLAAAYVDAESGAWRAVAARAMLTPEQGRARRGAMVDVDLRVRRAALTAAISAPDVDDLEALLEVSRLDPDPHVRALAVRALGALGEERALLALADRWPSAEETLRTELVAAWALPVAADVGGETQLRRVLETSAGLPALLAAGALASRPGPTGPLGVESLLRGLADGSTEERRLAIRLLPTGLPEVRAALEAAADSPDRAVRVLALARLLEVTPRSPDRRSALRELAATDGDDSIARQARAALAAAGDTSVRDPLLRELRAPRSLRRRLAAQALIALGDHAAAAAALGDDDPAVRAAVACRLLTD